MKASAAGDFAALRALVDDDAVMLPPGGPPQRGATDFDAAFERMNAGPKTHEVIEYRLDFEEVKVFGNYAVEWGAIRGATREICDRPRDPVRVPRHAHAAPAAERQLESLAFDLDPERAVIITQVALVVRDYDDAIRFFTQALGFALVEDTPLGRRQALGARARRRAAPAPNSCSRAPRRPRSTTRIGNQTGGRVFLFLRDRRLPARLRAI